MTFMILPKVELSLGLILRLSSSGVEQSPEKACVGGANPSQPPSKYLEINLKKN